MTEALDLSAPPTVELDEERMRVVFDRFDPAAYRLFLRLKTLPESDVAFDAERDAYTMSAPARFARLVGLVAPPPAPDPLPLGEHLFDDQVFVTRRFLSVKRYAAYMQCGLGKTMIGLETCRQIRHRVAGSRCLIVTLNEIVRQWEEEAARFYPDGSCPVSRLRTRAEMIDWMARGEPGIRIVNYEKWNPAKGEPLKVNEASGVTLVVLDEGSRLRTQGGRQKWALIKSFDATEYKLVLSATPAPNDLFEFASQAGFLNKFRAEQSINAFFSRDAKTQKWVVKPHARNALFRWMATWSIYVNDPKRYGWRAGFADVPSPDYKVFDVPATPEQLELARTATADLKTGQMTLVPAESLGVVQRGRLSQIAKGFRYVREGKKRVVQRIPSNKPAAVAKVVRDEARGGAQVIVWTVYDAESDILAGEMTGVKGVAVLVGSTPDAERERILDDFKAGKVRVLVTRASVLGFGLNFQFVKALVFAGWDDSFERMYQAVRRAVRFGQDEPVRVYFPVVRELEGEVFDNVWAKQERFERSIAEMEDAFIAAEQENAA